MVGISFHCLVDLRTSQLLYLWIFLDLRTWKVRQILFWCYCMPKFKKEGKLLSSATYTLLWIIIRICISLWSCLRMLFATTATSQPNMHHMSQAQSSPQPLNLSQPSKLKAKLSARQAMSAAKPTPRDHSPPPSPPSKPKARLIAQHHYHHHHHHHHHHEDDRELSCSCPQQDSKNTILYRLLTDSYTYWTPVCCIGGKCHDGQILGQSKLKILLEESKRQAVQ